jgi:small conductance mechanosensitive channel
MELEKIISQLVEMAVSYGPKLLGALVVLFIGSWLVKGAVIAVSKLMDRSKIDTSLKPFLKGITEMLLKALLMISVIDMLGIEMTSFVAILGAAGLAVGMALSGTLQNFAGGVMILLFKPFKPGDVVNAQGHTGCVEEIQIFNTILKTPDNKTIILPNGGLSGASMVNFSTEETRRVDWTVGIGYGDDYDKAKAVLQRLCDEDTRILKDPAVEIVLGELADSSVNLYVRAWVESAAYFDVFFALNEKIYKTFDKEGLNIPYPQMDVHVNQVK